jgi:glycosyltransferase involved in cell wall biosynthesis
MKIALVHDDLIQHGGAERLFEAMTGVWPEADVFTSMTTWPTRRVDKIQTSFMQHLPFKEKLYRYYFPLYPLAFESFNSTKYDVVLSSSTRFAHGVITRPETLHICYMNTPPRMFWEPQVYFDNFPYPFRSLLNPFLSYLRLWDYAAAQRVDYFIANSKTPQARIKKYYGRDSQVIYPFVDLERFQPALFGQHFQSDAAAISSVTNRESPAAAKRSPSNHLNFGHGIHRARLTIHSSSAALQAESGYFLIVSRLATWKKIDIAIEACNQLQLPLKIIGEGPDKHRLQKIAGPTVELLGRLTDEEVVGYYQKCRALIFPQKEDFGITPLEAMAAGKPTIAYRAGGALETVIGGQTGELFSPQTTGALTKVLKNFDPRKYRAEDCRKQAEKFSKQRFQNELKNFVEECYQKHYVLRNR